MAVERRVERRRAATRGRLVNTALALFATHGIYEVTVEDITEAADVGKGTFYQHFPSKTVIIHHLLHDGVSELLDRCRREGRAAGTDKERVKRLLSAQFRFFDERPDLLILFHQVRGLLKLERPEVRSLQKEYARYIRFLAAVLGTSLDRRRYSRARLTQLACAMAGLVAGYLSYRRILGLKKHGGEDLEMPTHLFLEGIAGNSRTML